MRISETVLRDIELDEYTQTEVHVNAPATYQEDRAFMRRMEKISFDKMTKAELKKIYRIALSGLDVRCAVDLELAKIKRREAEKVADKSINHGLKYGEIFKEITKLLKGLRG